MRGGKAQNSERWLPGSGQSSPGRWKRACAGLIFAAAFICMAQDGHPGAATPATVQPSPNAAADSKSAANSAKPSRQQKVVAAQSDRKKLIADESTQLLSMALALKAEVDKTTKDTLSINVIRRADEIEKLAHNVKEKMKQSAGAS